MAEFGSFTDLDFPRVIDTSNVDFMAEFYTPLLNRAVFYRRGVGYFTTNWVKSAARGIANLADNGGSVEWLVSPELTERDWEALKTGDEAKRNDLLKKTLEESINTLRYGLEYNTLNAIAWMVADELLEIKLAVPKNDLSGNFHDKFGVCYDEDGNRVAFHGSQNDSEQALRNYEAYTIDCDWISKRDKQGVNHQESRFVRLWKGRDPNVAVYDIPAASEHQIAELREDGNRPYELIDEVETTTSEITLRKYQLDAVDAWFSNNHRGMFQMATGTGKTFTALAALQEYLETADESVLGVIAVPQKHLARQWDEEMGELGMESPKYVYGSANPDWKQDLSRIVSNIRLGISDFESIVTTHTTLADEYFKSKVSDVSTEAILIADEVHGLGSEYQRKGLLDTYNSRIGLSATPERYYDDEGTDYLLDYFGGIVYEYTLDDAIPEYLTPYRYYPLIVEMNEDELEEYQQMTQSVAAEFSKNNPDKELLQLLQSQRARITKRAIHKYDQLSEILESLDNPQHLLVYTNTDQIDTVGGILNEFGIVHHKFTYEEDDDLRSELLERFGEGEWDALVAMKCLDEGVDVPATRTAILMSNSGNPMQFVQRRGRVLRRAVGKDHATIYDIMVVPTLDPERDIAESEKNILKKELRRFEEFAATAENEHEARNRLESVRIAYRV